MAYLSLEFALFYKLIQGFLADSLACPSCSKNLTGCFGLIFGIRNDVPDIFLGPAKRNIGTVPEIDIFAFPQVDDQLVRWAVKPADARKDPYCRSRVANCL